MAAERRPVPGLDEFAGQSWSAWLERAGPPADTGAGMPGAPLCGSTGTVRVPATDRILSLAGSGSELEENGKSGSKKLDTMTLIKEDMDIFGHCPAHDEFYLVVCNHCSQVVKPQAFQKHCERRHGPLSKLYARATACHVAVNGQPVPGRTPGAAKALQEKLPGARGRAQPLPEHTDKDNNLCLFVPVVNLEKIPSIPKPDGHGIKVPPKAVPTNSKESLGKPAAAAVPKEPPVPAGVGGDSAMPESVPAPGDKDVGAPKAPPRSHRKLARKECDLNRQCGVRNPDTNKLCTRLLTCKIHSVHQRREVQGRAKDFDVLVAELKASTRRGDPPKDRSPPEKDPLHPALQDTPSLLQPPSTPPCRARLSHCLHPPRARLSSASDPEDAPATSGEGGTGGLPLPLPKGGSRVSSEESEEEGGEEPPRTPARPPRPQAFCTFGSRLVTPGCYVFDRRLDRFCAALGSMLEQHLSAHRWRKIPPAVVPPLHLPAAPPQPRCPPVRPCSPLPAPAAPPGGGGLPAAHQPHLHRGVAPGGGRLQPARVRGRGHAVHHLPPARQHPLALLQQTAPQQGQQIPPGTGGGHGHGAPALAAPRHGRQPPLQTDLFGGRRQGQKSGLGSPRQDETRPAGFALHRHPQRDRAGAPAAPRPALPCPPRCPGPPNAAAARAGAGGAPPGALRG
ncbi:ataxin-7-like protein 2 [Passer domesticus]|uniref:ataxin-7-like protein 2 n=1 Tax=Passer domesticus TaxID=48849 RepID=UPI0030FEDC9A